MEQKIERHSQLYALGMSKNWIGFSFMTAGIDMETVNSLPEEDWTETLEQLRISVESLKKGIAKTQKSDREKMDDFVKSLGQITGPELQDAESLEILEGALEIIRMAREFIEGGYKYIDSTQHEHNSN